LGRVGSAGCFASDGSRSQGTPRVADYHTVEELIFCSLMGQWGSPVGGCDGSPGPPCSLGREASCYQQNSKAWSLGFICACGSGSWHRVPMGQQSQWAGIFQCWQGSGGPGIYLCQGVSFQEAQQNEITRPAGLHRLIPMEQ
jgi:hypothetical protein